jgi:hypothetical protein
MTAIEADKPALIIKLGPQAGRLFTIEADEVVVGRDAECDLVINEREISRQHIRIKHQGEMYVVEDLESKNGTWVNDEPLKGERALRDNDRITLAKTVILQYVAVGATAPIPTGPQTAKPRLRLDRSARRVFVGEKEITPPLSLPQYKLLEMLVDANGAICTREEVVKTVWADAVSDGVSEQAIDALVRRLRDRLAEVAEDHEIVITIRGHGFRVEV